jgi:AraC-like DNA-binding protein
MQADCKPIRFSTDELPLRDRIPIWREFFGRSVFRTEIEPAPDVPFYANVTVRSVPSLELVTSAMSPVRFSRTPALIADGNDDVGFFVSTSGGTAAQRGREITFNAGDAVVMNAGEAGTCATPITARYRCVHIRRAELASLVPGLDDATLRRIAPDTETLQYLISYIRFLEEQQTSVNLELAKVAAVHLRDLFALVLGATRDAAFVAEGRGLRAARLQAIKRYIVDNVSHRELTISAVAARHRVAPRYVQRLFESEGTTFSEFVLNQRLARVLRMLADPRYEGWTVSAIALDAGFGDVSYFNRRFRRRFGAPPMRFRSWEGEADDLE